MNKRCYKVIFSRSLNCLVVVSEWAKSCGKGDNRTSTFFLARKKVGHFMQRLLVGVLLGLGLTVFSLVYAGGISEDVNAPRNQQPMVVQTASGITQVNIQTPTAAGVSMNQYSQFDVDKKGAVLANNRKSTKARIAGWVEANPYMARGEADVIVNQVNSNSASQLNGYVEVAGKRADVIIANPSGIAVNGGGFLNVNKTILSTGKTQLNNGRVTGHRIKQGRIKISGQGLDVRDGNYTALLSRSATINAGIYKGEGKLDVITGVNTVDTKGKVTPNRSQNDGTKPIVSIDTGKLGGMYAGSIRLIGTEKGVGVNNAGKIQSNQLTLSADGTLSNSGKIVTETSQIKTTGINNSGTINTKELQLETSTLNNSGKITQTSKQTLTIKAKELNNSGNLGVGQKSNTTKDNTDTSTTEAQSGKIYTDGKISVSERLDNRGEINAGGDVVLQLTNGLDNSGIIQVEKATLQTGRLTNSGNLLINEANLKGTELLNKENGLIDLTQATHFNFNQEIDNRGKIYVTDVINWDTATFKHADTGSIYTNSVLNLKSKEVRSAGQLVADDNLSIQAQQISNTGHIQTQQNLSVTSDKLKNMASGQLTARQIDINSASISNAGDIRQTSDADFTITTAVLDNTGNLGRLPQPAKTSSNTQIVPTNHQVNTNVNGSINSQGLTNTGNIVSNGKTTLTVSEEMKNKGNIDVTNLNSNANQLNNSGEIYANLSRLSGLRFNNTGSLSSKTIKTFDYTGHIDNRGEILTTNNLNIYTPSLDNQGQLSSVASIIFNTPNWLNSGEISAKSEVSLFAQSAENSGQLLSSEQLTVQSDKLSNRKTGRLQAGRLAVSTGHLENKGSMTQTDKAQLTITADKLDNQKSGVLGKFLSNNSATDPAKNTKTDNNSAARGYIKVDTQLTNAGQLTGNGEVRLVTGSRLANRGQINLTVLSHQSGNIDNSTGQLTADRMSLSGTVLYNNKGALSAKTFTQFDFVDSINNQAGQIVGQSDYRVNTRYLNNTQSGVLSGANYLDVYADNIDTNGAIIAGKDLSIVTGTTQSGQFNNQGYIGSGSTLSLSTDKLNNQTANATITANQLQVKATQLVNSGTIVQSSGNQLTITADKVNNTSNAQLGAALVSADNPSNKHQNDGSQITKTTEAGFITVTDSLTNRHKIIANGETQLQSQNHLNNAGRIKVNHLIHEGGEFKNTGKLFTERANLKGQQLTNTGLLSSDAFNDIDFNRLDNSGLLIGAKAYAIKAKQLHNQGKDSQIASNETLTIQVNEVSNVGSIIADSQTLNIGKKLDNTGAIHAQQQVNIKGKNADIDNRGVIQSGKNDLTITTKSLTNKISGKVFAGSQAILNIANIVDNLGVINAAKKLSVNTQTLVNRKVAILQGNETNIKADKLITNDGHIGSATIQQIATHQLVNNQTLGATDSQTIVANQLSNKGDIIAKQLAITTKTTNNSGNIQQTDGFDLSIQTKKLENQATGQIGHANQLNSNGQSTNGNAVQPTKQGHLVATEQLTNSGTIDTGGQVAVNATQTLTNAGLLTASSLDSSGDDFTNTGDLQVSHAKITAKQVTQKGNLTTKQLTVDSDNLDNSGSIHSDTADLSIAKRFVNQLKLLISGELTVKANTLENQNNALIKSQGSLTYEGQQLTNQGQILTGGEQNLTAKQLTNVGLIAAQNKQAVKAATLNNQKGGEIDGGQMDWQLDNLNNSGLIMHTGQSLLTINSNLVNNANVIGQSPIKLDNQAAALGKVGTGASTGKDTGQGTEQSAGSTIKVTNQLDNKQTGYLVSNHAVNLSADKALNNSGQIAVNQLQVKGDQLTNSQTVNAKTIDIDNTAVDNTGGLMVADKATIKSQALINKKGTIGTKDKLALVINGILHNDFGQLLSKASLTIATNSLGNQQGKIQANKTNQITATTLNNRGGNIYGEQVEVDFSTLDNRASGRVAGKKTATLKGTQTIENKAGELVAGESLTLSGANLAVNNTSGKIRGQDILLTAKSLSGDEGILASRDLGLHLKDNLNLAADKVVNGHLALSSSGDINNTVILSGGKTVSLTGKNVANSTTGQIISNAKTHIVAEQLNNEGLINSNGLTHLDVVNRLTNQSTGRIYGNHVAIEASTLTNANDTDKSGIIAARERLDIGVNDIHNADDAELQSQGSLYIGGQLDNQQKATGMADSLVNDGGLIEAKSDGDIAVKMLKNLNSSLVIKFLPSKKKWLESYGEIDKSETFIDGVDGKYTRSGRNIYFDFFDPNKKDLHWRHSEVGKVLWWEYYQYAQEQKIESSHPGQIIIGGNLNISGSHWRNKDSKVVIGGDLFGDENKLINQEETKGIRREENKGIAGRFTYRKSHWHSRRRTIHIHDYDKNFYEKKEIKYHFKQPTTVIKTNTQPEFKGSTLKTNKTLVANKTVIGKEGISFKTLMTLVIGLPDSSLFIVNTKNTDVLVKTDPAFLGGSEQATMVSQQSGEQYNRAVAKSEVKKPIADTPTPTHSGDVLGINTALREQATQRLTNITQSIDSTVKPKGETPQAVSFVEANPDFTAPYVPAKLANNPAFKPDMHKRIGDGYYEQRLVQEQISQLTGRRFAKGYDNDLEQYKALLNNGASFAEQYDLTPGVRLSSKQMQNLTSDLIWLENQEVVLPNGTKQTVMVPKVYLRSRNIDTNTAGSLISAKHINLKAGKLNNQGTIVGYESNTLKGKNINISGHVIGGSVDIDAANQVSINGGSVIAEDKLIVKGNSVDIASTTSNYGEGNQLSTGKVIDSVAGLYLTGSDKASAVNAIAVQSEKDINLKGTKIINNAKDKGITQLVSETGSVNIDTIKTSKKEGFGKLTDKNHRRLAIDREVGSEINSNTNTVILAGDKVMIRQGDVNSTNGHIDIRGENGVDITEGRYKERIKAATYDKSRGLFSSTKTKIRVNNQDDLAISSNVTGKTIAIQSGKDADINIKGSNVISDNGTFLKAGKDVNIASAKNFTNHNDFEKKTKSGIFSSGGFGFTIGKKKQSTDARNTQTMHTGSMVGNLKKGNTNIVAGEQYTQSGSTVNSLGGDVNIAAKQIDVQSVTNTASQDTVHKFKQSGLTVSLSVPVIDAVTGLASSAKTMGKSKNSRVNAMAAANTALQGYEAGQAIQNFADNPKSGVSLSISLGSQKSKSESHIKSGEVQASHIQAVGEANLVATGDKQSSMTIKGSDIAGAKGTNLYADNDIRLMAGSATNSERSSNKSSGGSIGLKISSTGEFGVSVSANKGKGYGNGDGTTYRNSHVGSAASKTTLNTGEKLTLKGAQILGKAAKVTAKDLDIESLQNSSSYKGKQKNMGGSLTVGLTGVSGSANYGKSKINADHQAVAEQSGILAGDEGFQVNIQNHTDLKGGIITSTQKAQNDGTNSFKTGTIATENLQNHSEYDAKGFAISGGVDLKGGWSGNTVDKQGKPTTGVSKSIGYGKDSDSQSNITTSGIGTDNIIITDKSNPLSAEQVKTSKTTEQVLADSGLQNRFDKDKVQSEIDLQVSVTQSFDKTRQGVKRLLNKKLNELKESGASQSEIDNLQTAGLILDGIAGALYTPNANGIIGDAAQIASPHIAKQIGDYFTGDKKDSAAHGVAHAVLAAAVAAAGGNDAITAGLSAGSAELAAPLVSKYLYGDTKTSELTAEQKQTISNITGLIGTAAGATTGNVTDAVASGRASENAVDNNYLNYHEAKELADAKKSLRQCIKEGGSNCSQFKDKVDALNVLDRERGEEFQGCIADPEQPGCSDVAKEMLSFLESYDENGYIRGIGGLIGKERIQLADQVDKINARLAHPEGFVGLAKATANLGSDFTPIIGDIKSFVEAETIGDYVFATIGVVPVLGDGVKKAHDAYKIAKKAGDVKGMKKAISEVNEIYEKANINAVSRNGAKINGANLTKNLEKAGIPKPKGTQAHHIVGGTTDAGKATRKRLEKLGIDVNSSANGVFLPGCGSSKAVGMVHCGKHTADYEKAIEDELKFATTKEEAIEILSDIRKQLIDGTFTPLNKRSTKK